MLTERVSAENAFLQPAPVPEGKPCDGRDVVRLLTRLFRDRPAVQRVVAACPAAELPREKPPKHAHGDGAD